ncbi:mannose-P-dolichol utilization defect 1 protein-like [Saccoglossus kowalevskii]|uniref:Mannose-P-dolichol utilization defect 1 protein homolog n=1 Tax=Saccoglossus kowalevskii TaxID=10224 RepID=A0ABM0GNZ5_SACKO|nr:PREDICTED: mannose-P-dolichol utilization defect 1 protein-like [Saccoglossus kowalevskii]
METISWFQTLVLFFLPQHCYDEFFVKFNLLDVPCIKVAISKGLGMGIIVGSVIVKLPQILKILAAQSGEGISFISVVLELVAISATWSYSVASGFPFVAWGESFFLAVQSITIGILVLYYSGKSGAALIFLSLYSVMMYTLLSGLVSIQFLAFLQSMNIVMIVISRLMQVVANLRNGHTGQLSFITYLMLFLGSIARIFTSIQETGDPTMIATYIVSTTCNCVIVSQILYYSSVKPKKE